MDKEDIKKLIKKEITPLLIGIRNDLDEHRSKFIYEDSEIAGVLIKGEKGDDGYSPIPDKDYPSEKTVFNFIKENLPKRGKDYFTDADIKSIVKDVFALMPKKEDLKGENGKDGIVDYSTVKELATPIISAKYKELKGYVDKATAVLLEKIENSKQPEQTAEQIRNKLESLKGNARLDAKAIKGIEKFIGSMIISGGGSGGQDLSQYWKTDGSSSPATGDWNLGTQNLLFGSFNTANITGESNIAIGKDEYFALDLSKEYLRYIASTYNFWYYPSNLSTPPTVSIGDTWLYIVNGIKTELTVVSANLRTQGPVTGYDIVFQQSYTPISGDYIQKNTNVIYNANQIVSNQSILIGKFNNTNSFSLNVFISGISNIDTMLATSPLFIVGNSNQSRGGVYLGDSNINTRSTTSNPSTLKTIFIGNSNNDSSTDASSHYIVGSTNTISGNGGAITLVGSSNTITNSTISVCSGSTLSGTDTFGLGLLLTISGNRAVAIGGLNKSRAFGEIVLGYNSEDVTALSATAYNALDWQLRLGSGINNLSPSGSRDIFRIRKNGEIWNYLQTATAVGQTIKLFTAHSADAWQIQDVSGNVLTRFTSAGSLQFNANNIITDTTTGTKIGTATTQKLGFWNKTPVIQQVTNAYTSDTESVAYTGIDNLQAGTVYAKLADLNALRTAYETLRASYDDLLTKLKNTGIVA